MDTYLVLIRLGALLSVRCVLPLAPVYTQYLAMASQAASLYFIVVADTYEEED